MARASSQLTSVSSEEASNLPGTSGSLPGTDVDEGHGRPQVGQPDVGPGLTGRSVGGAAIDISREESAADDKEGIGLDGSL